MCDWSVEPGRHISTSHTEGRNARRRLSAFDHQTSYGVKHSLTMIDLQPLRANREGWLLGTNRLPG